MRCVEELSILVVMHVAFFWKFYRNPWLLNTSEVASNFFPFWKWAGSHLPFRDKIYYLYPACIPFLSVF